MKHLSRKRKVILLVVVLVITAGIITITIYASGNSVENRLLKQLSLGERYLSEMEYVKAVVAYKKAVEIDPENADANMGLAEAYAGSGDDESAREVLQNALDKILSLSEGKVSETEIQKLKKALERYVPMISTPNPTLTSMPRSNPMDTTKPMSTSIPSPTPLKTPSLIPTNTPSSMPINTPSPTPTSTSSPTPTSTPSPTPTNTPSPTFINTLV